ncbi:hypothetical protein [Streptomyces parvus]|uniref:hypothetical protein n=1 Tax=Streptomyces parvus TaxID=66428 RepID=UPI00331B6904
MNEIAPLAARVFARPATGVIGAWWAKRQGRRLVALRLPSVTPHRNCKNGLHASLGESVVTNFSTEPVFDVHLRLARRGEPDLVTNPRVDLSAGDKWTFDWREHRGRGAVPLLHPDGDGQYNVAMDLMWADRPGGPLWQRGMDGRVKRALGHQLWRRALRSVRS